MLADVRVVAAEVEAEVARVVDEAEEVVVGSEGDAEDEEWAELLLLLAGVVELLDSTWELLLEWADGLVERTVLELLLSRGVVSAEELLDGWIELELLALVVSVELEWAELELLA